MMDASLRRITHVTRNMPVIDDGDMRLYRVLPDAGHTTIGPFVFFDHFRSTGLQGIGDQPHPHAGIEVLSYLLEGGVEHRDSLGSRDRLGAGDAQWIRAGRGVVHAERPLSARHGLQMWTSLPPEQKFAEPAYRSWRASEIPEIASDAGSVRVVAGTANGLTGPMRLARPTMLVVLHLEANARLDVDVDPDAELGLSVVAGAIDDPSQGSIGAGGLATLSRGHRVSVCATGEGAADVVILGGDPIFEAVLFSGPFVMDTVEHLDRARRAYASGSMGILA